MNTCPFVDAFAIYARYATLKIFFHTNGEGADNTDKVLLANRCAVQPVKPIILAYTGHSESVVEIDVFFLTCISD